MPNQAVKESLTQTGLRQLEDAWLRDFHSSKRGDGDNARRWFNVVIDFLTWRGDEIMPGALREQEERILALGMAREYMAALAEVVGGEGARTEYDKAVLVLTASAIERAQALRRVLGEPQR